MNRGPAIEISSRSFSLVDAAFLLGRRALLESSGVPVYLVRSKGLQTFVVESVSLEWIASQGLLGLARAEFAVARQWARLPDSPAPSQDSFETRWNAMAALGPEERARTLQQAREEADRELSQTGDPTRRAQLAAGLTETAFLVNRASLVLEKAGRGQWASAVADQTVAVVRSVLQILEDNPRAVALMRHMDSPSGSRTLDHIVRVFALTAGFLLHYNRAHSAGLVARLRPRFGAYLPVYRRLVPHLSEGRLTMDNLVRLPALTPAQVRTHALGALLHDIGKIHDLDYFETGTVYDREKILRHPILGSGLFLRTYGPGLEEARVIIAEHHNYLFHEDGYGVLRAERKKSGNPVPLPECSVGDTLASYTSGHALAFLPVEACTLADVYDALTDPHRPYKEASEPAAALETMKVQFTARGKLDPVLFDLFREYLDTLA
jgi:hypothetical protein